MSPLPLSALSLSSITLPSHLRLFSLPTTIYFPAVFTTSPAPCFLFLLFLNFFSPSCPPFTRPSFRCPKVISTERPSMRIQCWRLRGADSWNSSSLSSLSPKASSHLKVSATSEVRSQAPTKGVISFLSIHVCDWVVCEGDCVSKAIIAAVLDFACYFVMIC